MSARWPSAYCCYVCARSPGHPIVRATVRVFSSRSEGGYSCGGFAACAEHEDRAVSAALRPIREGEHPWSVRAYYVDANEHDDPQMTRKMFTAYSRRAT